MSSISFQVLELTFEVIHDTGKAVLEFRFGHVIPATFDQATVVIAGGVGVTGDLVDYFGFRAFVMIVIEIKVPE